MSHAPVAIGEMDKMDCGLCILLRIRLHLVPDHFAPNKDIKSAELCKCVRGVCNEANDITNYFEAGRDGD